MKYGFAKKAGFFLAGLIMLPVTAGAVLEALRHLSGSGLRGREGISFIAGIAVYILLHLICYKPITMHVFGHEMTHAFWSWIFGGKVQSFRATKEGGEVVVTKSNFFVLLAPYFFPLYSMLIVLLYGAVYLITGNPGWFVFFAFLLGMSIGFHIAMTLHSLRVQQSDLSKPGYFFSIEFIILLNTFILMLLFSFFFTGLSFTGFLKSAGLRSLDIMLFAKGMFK